MMNYFNRNNFPTYLLNVISIKPIDPDFIAIKKEVEGIENLYYSYFLPYNLQIKELKGRKDKVINIDNLLLLMKTVKIIFLKKVITLLKWIIKNARKK